MSGDPPVQGDRDEPATDAIAQRRQTRAALTLAIGVLLAVGVREIGVRALLRSLDTPTFSIGLAMNLVADAVVAMGIVVTVILVEKRPVSSIGIRRLRRRDIELAALATVVLLLLGALTARGRGPGVESFNRVLELSLPLRIALVLVVPLAEEVFFRGLLIERVADVTGRLWLGAAVSAAVFAMAHLEYWETAYVLFGTLPRGVVFSLLYVRTRNLGACVIAHFFLVAPILFLRP